MPRDTSTTLTPGTRRMQASEAGRRPSDIATIADDSALGIARDNLDACIRAMPSDHGRYREARATYLETARTLQNRSAKLTQRLGEINVLEEAAGLPLTVVARPASPEPVTADEYAMPAEGV